MKHDDQFEFGFVVPEPEPTTQKKHRLEPDLAERKAMFRADDPDTSREAADSFTTERLSECRRDVLQFFANRADALDEQVEVGLWDKYPTYSTARKRRGELVKMGLLYDTGTKRPNSKGRNMIVWAVTKRGIAVAKALREVAA